MSLLPQLLDLKRSNFITDTELKTKFVAVITPINIEGWILMIISFSATKAKVLA